MDPLNVAGIRQITRRVAKEMCLVINDVSASATTEKEILKCLRAVIGSQPKLANIKYSRAMIRLLCMEENNAVSLAGAGEKKEGRAWGRLPGDSVYGYKIYKRKDQ